MPFKQLLKQQELIHIVLGMFTASKLVFICKIFFSLLFPKWLSENK